MDVNAYARQLKALLPSGPAWNLEAESVLSKFLLAAAEELARVDARALSLIDESDPRSTSEMLTDWERALSLPDTCVTDAQSVAQRRAAATARYIAQGGQSRAYFISVALALGFVVTITEFSPFDVDSGCDDFICGDDWAFAWQVNAPLNTVGEFASVDTADDALAWWGNDLLECVIARLSPAHTYVLFAYA